MTDVAAGAADWADVPGFVARPDGDLLRLVGNEPLIALDRIVTQAVRSLPDGGGSLALLLAPKGQFRATMVVFRLGEEVLLLAPPGRGDELRGQLTGYLRFNRVAVEPVTTGGGTIELVGAAARRPVAERAGFDAAAVVGGGCASVGEPGSRLLWLGSTFSGGAGAMVACESAAARERLDGSLRQCGASPLGDDVVELARIRVGFPAWGRELTETVLPPEVGIESLAISYTKGCYVGQETIARMKTYGHPNRALVGVRQSSGDGEPPELPLALTAAGEERARGTLTSWAHHPRLGGFGLALVRRELAAHGTALAAAGRTFTITPFPLW